MKRLISSFKQRKADVEAFDELAAELCPVASDFLCSAGADGIGIAQGPAGAWVQIQSLERDSSESGRKLLNDTSHDAVVAALQAGYRHLDTAHGYYNERGVGQDIIDSGVPREERLKSVRRVARIG